MKKYFRLIALALVALIMALPVSVLAETTDYHAHDKGTETKLNLKTK